PAAEHHANQAGRSKEMQRTSHVAQEKTNGEQIEEYAESSRDAVMGFSAGTNDIADRYFYDLGSVPGGKRGNEAVHFTVQPDIFDNFAAVNLEGRTEIMNINAEKFGHHPVGDARRNAAQEEIIDTFLAPAADDVAARGFERLEHGGNVIRVVLKVAVHGNDDIAGSI